MNYAQLKGERIVRCDARWSPLAVPLMGMAEALVACGQSVWSLKSPMFGCGHPRSLENEVVRDGGRTRCKICERARSAASRDKNKAGKAGEDGDDYSVCD